MKNYRLVIFDVDGLMLNTEFLWLQAHERFARENNLPQMGKELFLKSMGLSRKDFQKILEEDVNDPRAEEWMNQIRKDALKMIEEEVEPMPGLIELLDLLEELNIDRAIATATFRQLTEQRLKKLGICDRFSCILCGDEITKRKPDPEPYLKVLEKTGCEAKDALVLEDSIYGVESAYRAGIDCIMVPSLHEPGEKQEKETVMICRSLYDVRDYITKS